MNGLTQVGALPSGAQPVLPPTSPIGEIFRYRVVGPPGYSVTDLKTIQDWILLRRLKSVPGVIDVTSWGGKSKTFDITVDLDKLLAYGLTLKQVLDSLNGANINVGANTVNLGPQSAVIRSVGQSRTMADIGHTMLTVRDGSPVLVSDVATITVGHEPRAGAAGHDDGDGIIEGIVLMRRGAETLPTLRAIKKEVERINGSDLLPPGVRIARIYDRSVLVDVTTSTVLHNMVMGVCFVFLIQWLFLGDLRSALIVSATIPFALLFAVVILVLSGESANLLSLGAIDFGIIVDAAVLLPERVSETETIVVRRVRRLYRRVVDRVLPRRGLTLAIGAGLVGCAAFAASTVGLEFLPKLEEGNIWLRAALPPSVSLDEGNVYANRMRRMVKSFPEVETVITQHGRPDDGTDPDGFSNVEFFVPLKPFDQWRKGLSKDALVAEMADALHKGFPGTTFGFSQYIQDNVQEAASGIDAENAIKISGSDLDTLRSLAVEIRGVLEKVRGITDIQVPPLLGQPTIRIDIDRERAARYGLSPGDINATIQAAVGGQAAGDLYEEGSDRHFPLLVRLAPRYRENIEAPRRIAIRAPGPHGRGRPVPAAEGAPAPLPAGALY